MTLTTPLALLGLLSLPVIAALHMLRSRSRPYPVSSLSLWDFLRPQVRGSSARTLPLTWLLLLDLLIAAVLSLALAGPRLNLTRTVREGRHLILLIDTSTSMSAEDEIPSRFSAAQIGVRRMILDNAGADVITILSFASGARSAADSRSSNTDELLAALAALRPGGVGGELEAALALAQAAIDPQIPAELHIFTDAAFPPPRISDLNLPLTWHLYGSQGDNQAVLSLQAAPLSATKFQVFARFANFGPTAAVRTVRLLGDGRSLASLEITLESGTSQTQSWEVLGSVETVTVEFADRDVLPADDFAGTGMPAFGATRDASSPPVAIALVADPPGPLLRALEAAPGADVQVISPDDFLPGSPFDLFVFRRYLPARWPAGAVLVVDPPADSDLLGAVTAEYAAEIPFPQPDPLLSGVDFTGVRWDRVWAPERLPAAIGVLLAAGDTPLVLRGQVGLASLVLILAETAGENGAPSAFARHPAFPILIANVVQMAAGANLPAQIPLGSALPLPPAERFPSIRLLGPSGGPVELPSPRPSRWANVPGPGLYRLSVTDLDGQETHFFTGVNAGDLHESDIAPGEWPAGIAAPPRPPAAEQPRSLTPWLLALAALLFLIEARLSWR